VTLPAASREPHELDLMLVACAGDPALRGNPSETELALIGACVEVEEALREREWRALETVLPYLDRHDHLDEFRLPLAPGERSRLLGAIRDIGWHRDWQPGLDSPHWNAGAKGATGPWHPPDGTDGC
jgi:hypothetical protein